MRVQRLGVRVAANPKRVNEITTNKMNASIPIFRFRYHQCLPVTARSALPGSPSYSLAYVTVCITLPWSTDEYQIGYTGGGRAVRPGPPGRIRPKNNASP
jgi:hypothetical protein